MNQLIWETELKNLDRKLGKEGKKICLLCDNASVHKQIPLQKIELVNLMAHSTASLQVRFVVKWKYRQEVDIMDEMIENPDYEEGMLLQNAMEEMILEDEEQNQNDDDVE